MAKWADCGIGLDFLLIVEVKAFDHGIKDEFFFNELLLECTREMNETISQSCTELSIMSLQTK